MRSLAILSVGILSWLPTLCAQSPFQFREAWLLEHRIELTRSGGEYDPSHSEQLLSREGPGPAEQFNPDRGDVYI